MDAPVLTKKQQKQCLAAKKAPVKGLRNVLAQPQETYWPIVKDASAIECFLKESLPSLKRTSKTIPWSRLRRMNKEERRKAKKEVLVEESVLPDESVINTVILGINDVTRSLEKGNLCCVLLDGTVDPPLLVKHIVVMAQNKKVPILLVPFLKKLTVESIGFSSAAFALKTVVTNSTEHPFYKLYSKIVEETASFPPPQNLLQLGGEPQSVQDESPTSKTVEHNTTLRPDDPICKDTEDETSKSNVKPTFTLSTSVYKYRTSKRERAFLPLSTSEQLPDAMDEGENGFISLGHDSDSEVDSVSLRVPKNKRYIDIYKKGQEKIKVDSENANNQNNSMGKSSMEDQNGVPDSEKAKQHKIPDAKYLPLKVKRLQGNCKRSKATKLSKRKKINN